MNPRTPEGRGPEPRQVPQFADNEDGLRSFEKFLRVNLEYAPSTVRRTRQTIAKVLRGIGKPCHAITHEDLQDYCLQLETLAPKTRWNYKIDMRIFFRDFLKRPWLVADIKLPHLEAVGKDGGLSKHDVRAFYYALDDGEERLACLLGAVTGLRPSEVLELRVKDLDMATRKVSTSHDARTKRARFSFFNQEAETILKLVIARKNREDPVFSTPRRTLQKRFHRLSRAMGLRVTMQALRQFFADEMGRLNVPDRYIDAFQGRLPKSVLAKHYSDFSEENLRRIYEQAGLKVIAD